MFSWTVVEAAKTRGVKSADVFGDVGGDLVRDQAASCSAGVPSVCCGARDSRARRWRVIDVFRENFDADAVALHAVSDDTGGARSHERVEDGVARQGEEVDEPFGETLRGTRHCAACCRIRSPYAGRWTDRLCRGRSNWRFSCQSRYRRSLSSRTRSVGLNSRRRVFAQSPTGTMTASWYMSNERVLLNCSNRSQLSRKRLGHLPGKEFFLCQTNSSVHSQPWSRNAWISSRT